MRAVFFLCVCAYAAMGQDMSVMRSMPKYDARYDYLDVDAILDSKRLVKNYVECLINSTRCTPEGKALKRILPEALRTKCVRCSEKQKRTAVKVIKRIKYEYPEEWAKLASRWDPTGDFTRYFEEFLAKDDFHAILGDGTNEIPGASTVPSPPTPRPTLPPSTPRPTLPPTTTTAPPPPPVPTTISPRPVILNRFGDDEDDMSASPSSNNRPEPQPTMPTYSYVPTTARPNIAPINWNTFEPMPMPTKYPRPLPPAFSTAITIIDQIGYKIMRTTELVTDILRNTVRAVVGR